MRLVDELVIQRSKSTLLDPVIDSLTGAYLEQMSAGGFENYSLDYSCLFIGIPSHLIESLGEESVVIKFKSFSREYFV